MSLTRRNILKYGGVVAAGMAIPAVATIKKDFERAFKEVTTQRQWADVKSIRPQIDRAVSAIEQQVRTLSPQETLVVPMGEYHDRPSHIMMQYGVVSSLKDKGYSIAYGVEQPYNSLFDRNRVDMAKDRLSTDVDRDERDAKLISLECDRNGVISLQEAGSDFFEMSVVSRRIMQEYLLKQRVSTRYNDLAIRSVSGEVFLNDSDIGFVSLCQQLGLPCNRPIGALSSQGMYLRNAAMVRGGIGAHG